jgi:hypothetical protein
MFIKTLKIRDKLPKQPHRKPVSYNFRHNRGQTQTQEFIESDFRRDFLSVKDRLPMAYASVRLSELEVGPLDIFDH